MRELRFAPFVRLEVDCEMPLDVVQRLTMELGLSDKDDVYSICGPMALGGENSFKLFYVLRNSLGLYLSSIILHVKAGDHLELYYL